MVGVIASEATPAAMALKQKMQAASAASSVAGSEHMSEVSRHRLAYQPALPGVLRGAHGVEEGASRECAGSHDNICALFPKLSSSRALHMVQLTAGASAAAGGAAALERRPMKLGVVLSGGQAPGGHNVIIGLFDYLAKWHPGSTVVGFLGGPAGVMKNQFKLLTEGELAVFRNQGGFHVIGSGRDKIEKPDQLAAAAASAQAQDLDGLVVIGGDDSNTNAAVLAEYFLERGLKTRVIGVPKTIDGDLKNADVGISFGFDTACKVYSEMIGNIAIDALSAKKYYHFIRLMGRAASHVTLECALRTRPQLALICEEVHANKASLHDVTCQIADMVAQRAEQGKNYGVVLVPEGLVEHVQEVAVLLQELNELMAKGINAADFEDVLAHLTEDSADVLSRLPPGLRASLLEERDPHGNVQVAHIETEKLLIKLVHDELARRKANGTFHGKFSALSHYFGYEGRCSLPSNFDATYCNALGQAAGALLAAGRTGLMATISNLRLPTAEWGVGGTPLLSMMHLERRSGKDKPVIAKALVEMNGAPMRAFAAARPLWAIQDSFQSPGPIQFEGRCADEANITLALEVNDGAPILLAADAGCDACGRAPSA